jgi:hypothetical protein
VFGLFLDRSSELGAVLDDGINAERTHNGAQRSGESLLGVVVNGVLLVKEALGCLPD